MGLWDDEDDIQEDEEYKNPYLADPEQGLNLIAKLLPKHRRPTESDKAAYRLDKLLDRKILSAVQELGLKPLEISHQLSKISDQIMEYQKNRLLSGKVVIGLGGQFSAGKSSFINSCLGSGKAGQEIILPEDQNPTTSIPTYIVGDKEEHIYAYCGTAIIPLDRDALKAMTHEFFEAYHIGFSRFVDNIVIHTPAFPRHWADKVAFLDTPGYNKADLDTQEALKDEYLAKEQLKTVDFLIWLIDIGNGTIHERDIEFLQNIPHDTSVLIVVNKADKVDHAKMMSIVDGIKSVIDNKKIPVFGVAAYSSREGIDYSENMVSEFIKDAIKDARKKIKLEQTIDDLIATINKDFKQAISQEEERRSMLGESIDNSQDVMAIKSLAYFYGRTCQTKSRLVQGERDFNGIAKQIEKMVKSII
ncbi:MAG: dynamin family protein [Selenomonadales bacterium]|nr:dynamin family protein [Selenomonadales bacterium]MDD7762926.1 dynamin family protein [Selenomonadales bacterium]